MTTRRADVADLDALVATLVASHLGYAWERWAVVGKRRAVRLAAAFRSDLELLGLPHGVVTKVGHCDAVAVWLPANAPTAISPDVEAERQRLNAIVYGDRLEIVEEVDQLIGSASCPDAEWHLATMGTRPSRQRRGLGSEALRPMLEQLDRAQLSARLETSSTGNVTFYERHGFEVVVELELPHGAPTTWIMLRRPRTTSESVPITVRK